jgi:hypothetical protein
MKDFFQYREEIQQLDESAMTDALNHLQDFWNNNAEYFMGQSDPLFPMLSRPFDRIRKGGVLIVGINPGSSGLANEKRKQIYDLFTGAQPPVFNSKTRTWRNVDFNKVDPDNRGGKESNVGFSQFDTTEWEKRGGSNNSKYFKNLNLAFKKINRGLLDTKSTMAANLVPFPSTSKKSFGKHSAALKRLGADWIKEMVKNSKPKCVIALGGDVWDALDKNVITKSVPDATIKALSKDGAPTNTNLVRVGYIGNTVVIGIHHPSMGLGQPQTVNYKGDQLKGIQAVFDKYVKK